MKADPDSDISPGAEATLPATLNSEERTAAGASPAHKVGHQTET
jgi:hypothetical protein